jgi:hypothetical protein
MPQKVRDSCLVTDFVTVMVMAMETGLARVTGWVMGLDLVRGKDWVTDLAKEKEKVKGLDLARVRVMGCEKNLGLVTVTDLETVMPAFVQTGLVKVNPAETARVPRSAWGRVRLAWVAPRVAPRVRVMGLVKAKPCSRRRLLPPTFPLYRHSPAKRQDPAAMWRRLCRSAPGRRMRPPTPYSLWGSWVLLLLSV